MKPSELLSDATKWCQGSLAKDKYGENVVLYSPYAVCWCLKGAMHKCKISNKHWELISEKLNYQTASWNDDPKRTFEEVRALLIECGL